MNQVLNLLQVWKTLELIQGGIDIRRVFPKPPKKDFHSDKWLVGESLISQLIDETLPSDSLSSSNNPTSKPCSCYLGTLTPRSRTRSQVGKIGSHSFPANQQSD